MLSRRGLLQSSSAIAALSVAGCFFPETGSEPPAKLPVRSIDMHAHMFNATDIPIQGFLEQVFLRNPETPVTGDYPVPALIRLIVEIFTGNVRTAKEELDVIGGSGDVAKTDPEALRAQDEAAVADGVNRFAIRTRSAPPGIPEASEDAQLLAALSAFTGAQPEGLADAPTFGASVAEAVFAPNTGIRTPSLFGGIDVDLGQTLRWAGLLTRDRRDILAEMQRLYGQRRTGDGSLAAGIGVFSPSIVDFEYWFETAPQRRYSPIADQMTLMSRMALRETGSVLLNFAPFCPLRAIRERRRGRDWHAVLRHAVEARGFVGIKIYPPMGFKPWGNAEDEIFGKRERATGVEVNRELKRLYAWCSEMGVPIKAHGNNSLAAEQCSGQNAAPDLWAPVIDAFPELRVNIAHFGGFDEDMPVGRCADMPPAYEARAAALMAPGNRIYVDLGYWTEVAGRNRPGSAFIDKVNDLLAQRPVLGERILYGSDYSMIGRVRDHGNYLNDVYTAIGKLNGTSPEMIFSANARAYLGIDDPDSPIRRRLRRFFPAGHPYYEVFGR